MMSELGEHVTLLSSIGIVVVGFGVSLWKMGNGIKSDVDDKVRRNYQRLDELKDTHVSKEVCGIVSKHITDTLDEVKSDVKKLLGKNGIK